MAIRSTITARLSDGTYRGVYCRWDGTRWTLVCDDLKDVLLFTSLGSVPA